VLKSFSPLDDRAIDCLIKLTFKILLIILKCNIAYKPLFPWGNMARSIYGKVALVLDKESKHYGRVGFNYLISTNAKKKTSYYSIYLLPDGQKIRLKEDLTRQRRLMLFKDLEHLSEYLEAENRIAF